VVDGQREIVANPPLIVPVEELAADANYGMLRSLVSDYARTLPADRQHLLGRFRLTRVARKVVGVGSVGTQAWILLMEAEDDLDPLLLQAKQAERSVLAAYAGESQYDNQGERVVAGQRLMQAASDIFLGWQRTTVPGFWPNGLLSAPATGLEVFRADRVDGPGGDDGLRPGGGHARRLTAPRHQARARTIACRIRPTPAPTTVPLMRMYCRSRPRSSSSWLDVSAASQRSMVPVTRPASSSWK